MFIKMFCEFHLNFHNVYLTEEIICQKQKKNVHRSAQILRNYIVFVKSNVFHVN